MNSNRFSSDSGLPYIEIRHTTDSIQSYKDHIHPELFIAAVTKGQTSFETPRESAIADAGNLVVLPPETVHRCVPNSGPRSYIAAFIDPDWCLELQNELFGEADQLFLPHPALLEDSCLFNSFIKLIKLLEEPAFKLEKQEALSGWMTGLLSLKSPSQLNETESIPGIVDKMKTRLACEPSTQLSLVQLATELGYSQHYLLRCFKKTVGLTPHEYRLNLRIEQAKRLLRQGVPPAAVAAETGFVDQSHLHRTFKQFVSATPRQFQRRAT